MHIADLVLTDTDDRDIWHLAAERGDVIVTKDADFADFVLASKTKQAVVWMRMGDTRKKELCARLSDALPRIVEALNAGERSVEVR